MLLSGGDTASAQQRRWRATMHDATVRDDTYFDSVGVDYAYVHYTAALRDSLPLNAIDLLEERVTGSSSPGAGIGALAGAGLGFGIGLIVGANPGEGCCPPMVFAIPLGVIGLFAGTLIGGVVGTLSDVTAAEIDLSNMTLEQRRWTIRHRVLK